MLKVESDDLMIQRAHRYLYLEQRRLKWLIGNAERRNVLIPEEIAQMQDQLGILDFLIGKINKM